MPVAVLVDVTLICELGIGTGWGLECSNSVGNGLDSGLRKTIVKAAWKVSGLAAREPISWRVGHGGGGEGNGPGDPFYETFYETFYEPIVRLLAPISIKCDKSTSKAKRS